MWAQFDDAYEGVCSLRNIRESNQGESLTDNEINNNLRMLKTNLTHSKAPYAKHFRKYLKKKTASDFLEAEAYTILCGAYESKRLLHLLRIDKSWKKSNEKNGRSHGRGDVWKNPAFGSKLAKEQSEGTYMTDVIVPMIRASLKGLPIGKSGYISTAERQSKTSKDRRGIGKRPDLMFI
ncbi:2634_t:CDS:2, partial [Paraglomus occultum]